MKVIHQIGASADYFYRKIGNTGICFILFALSFGINAVFALQVTLPSVDPAEFTGAAWAALFTGRNWSGVMGASGYYGGYLTSVLYAPVMLVIRNPYIQYHAFLLINSALVSIIPVTAYNAARFAGVEKAWLRVGASVVCGMYPSVFLHTKFIWNETACIVMPWVLLAVLMNLWAERRLARRVFKSVAAALVLVMSFAAHERLIALSIAVVLLTAFVRIFYKRWLICLPPFAVSAVLLFFGEYMLKRRLVGLLWNGTGYTYGSLSNTVPAFFGGVRSAVFAESMSRVPSLVFGHLYYFVTSTWGIGAFALCVSAWAAARLFKLKKENAALAKKSRDKLKIQRSGDKRTDNRVTDSRRKKLRFPNIALKRSGLEKIEMDINFSNFSLICAFAFFVNLVSGIGSIVYKAVSADFAAYQDGVIFGRYMDSAIPLLLLVLICYIFLYGLDIRFLLRGGAVMAAVFIGFFIFAASGVLSADMIRMSPILSFYPLRVGEDVLSLLTLGSLGIAVSVVFSFAALLAVIICCSKRYRNLIISGILCITMWYSCVFTAAVYIPFCVTNAGLHNEPVVGVAEALFDSEESPPVVLAGLPRRTVLLLRCLKRDVHMETVSNPLDAPLHCFIVTRIENDLPPEYTLIGKSKMYAVYAYGERAKSYYNSQHDVA